MITILLFIIAAFVFGLLVESEFLIVFISMLGVVIAMVIDNNYVVKKSSTPLACLNDGTSLKGNFFLGSGYVDEQMTYTYYVKVKDYYKLEQLPASDVLIKYTKGPARILKVEQVEDNSFRSYFGIGRPNTRFVIYVPKGSIKNNYQLDAK